MNKDVHIRQPACFATIFRSCRAVDQLCACVCVCVRVCVFACLDDNFPTECTLISAFGVVVHLDPIWVKFVGQSQRSKVQGHRRNMLLFRRKATVKLGKPGWLVDVEEKQT